MIATIVRQGAAVVRVIIGDAPMPPKERARLERAGMTVSEQVAPRVRCADDYTDLVTPLLQRELFA